MMERVTSLYISGSSDGQLEDKGGWQHELRSCGRRINTFNLHVYVILVTCGVKSPRKVLCLGSKWTVFIMGKSGSVKDGNPLGFPNIEMALP